MKEEQKQKKGWISFRVKPDEYDKIHGNFKKSACRKFSDYARKTLMEKPVVVTYRNQSTDDFLTLAADLFKTLNGIGNNFNQAVKKLHVLHELPEYRSWYVKWSVDREILLNRIGEVKRTVLKIYEDGRKNN